MLNRYLTQWQPRDYLKAFYSTATIPDESQAVLSFLIDRLAVASNRWNTALDFGCGPTIWGVLPIVPHVREIHIADFLQSNLDEIQSWLDCSRGAHDWSKYVRCVLELEGNDSQAEDISNREQLLRDKVQRLIRADIRDDSSMQDWHNSYDVIVSLYCLECMSDSLDHWQNALIKLGSAVAPGGLLLMASVLRADRYYVGSQAFEMTNISESDIHKALMKAGFEESNIEVQTVVVDAWKHEGFDQIALIATRR